MKPLVSLDLLTEAIEQSWSAATSTESDWTQENPAWGQCAVSSLVVQDYLGGDLLNTYTQIQGEDAPRSHYFNRVDGVEIDLTRKQFPAGTHIPNGVAKPKTFASTRQYVLSFELTQDRYVLLSDRVDDYIAKKLR